MQLLNKECIEKACNKLGYDLSENQVDMVINDLKSKGVIKNCCFTESSENCEDNVDSSNKALHPELISSIESTISESSNEIIDKNEKYDKTDQFEAKDNVEVEKVLENDEILEKLFF